MLTEWMPKYVVDRHYLIMLTNVHTLTPLACLQVVWVLWCLMKWYSSGEIDYVKCGYDNHTCEPIYQSCFIVYDLGCIESVTNM